MDRDALFDFLRENLRIAITTSSYSDFGSKGMKVEVTLTLSDEPISTSEDTFDFETRDTSENWRGRFE
ncbi:MAG: hypothetical protein EOO77_31250 [Oxalobacteraceae bacterium]|nr:MAG: hypothetical protein EOO77_31250 [Oxalobacteraceae bacterium]